MVHICEHFLKLTGTSMISFVVELVSLSKYDSNDECCSRGITNLRELKHKFIQRSMMFLEILYVVVFRWSERV